ncbi:MAG: tetratricopeptide repeat protein [Saprospiraceae bacterium]
MIRLQHSFSTLFLCIPFLAFGQISFKDSLIRANPVPPGSNYKMEEKVKAHRDFLARSIARREAQKQIFGYIYLFSDYVLAADYGEATRQLLEADRVVSASGNTVWAGEILSRKAVISVQLENMAEAAAQFKQAANLFEQAKDTLRMAECLEQTGATYSHLSNFDQAQKYYRIALPLLEKYGNKRQLRVAFGNFGNVLLYQNRPAAAILYFEKALKINRNLGDREKEAQDLSDLANAYGHLKKFDKAIELYRQAVRIAEEQNLPAVLYLTYADLAETCEDMGDYQSAYSNFKKYHQLRDSIVGAETQEKIEGIKILYETKEKERALQKSRAELVKSKEVVNYQNVIILLAIICLALAAAMALKFLKDRDKNILLHDAQQKVLQQELKLKAMEQAKLESQLVSNKKDLTDFAFDIARKNDFAESLLLKIESLIAQKDESSQKALRMLQNFILTHNLLNQERAVFQEKFHEVGHDFFQKLNTRFGDLSQSEKEICGFIRLNLSNKEIAAMKSISPNSAKIARYRLRKRLGLDAEEDIVAFLKGL